MKYSNTILGLLFAVGFIPFCNTVIAQNVSKAALIKYWKLEKYYEEGEYYPPNKKEVKDFIDLKGNMTFTAVMEGKTYSGTWMLNTNGSYIELKYNTQGIDKLRIKWISKVNLVVIFDLDYYRYTEVHYNSCKD